MRSSLLIFLAVCDACLSYEHHAVSGHKGASLRSRRMVGGSFARNIPWQALVYFGDSVINGGIGGGALVSDRWVLTSGRNLFVNKTRQATSRQPVDLPKVYLGITNIKPLDPSKEVEIEKVVLHPKFQETSTWDNNLALIKLKKAVVFSESVMPIPLPEAGQNAEEMAGMWGVITGWGWGRFFSFTDHLKYLVVPVCQTDDKNTFCTRTNPFQGDVCFGDEGGALVVLDKYSQVYAAGILSNDKSCARENFAIYTKLSAYMPWINRVMREDSDSYSVLRTSIMANMLSSQ
ncbi:hypothetical protein AGOR_G00167790 [Albula goreensis]|uniref:Peptidase S1 domain-containing protein n=1 Tax=Albula goreensis TaxID=1534307 RepID=A0A8T3D0A9_9TELE|nr:hypothetical protein AGOR_G00167790 [Albula goreensis]